MRKTVPPVPLPAEAASAAEGKALAIDRACKLAPGMVGLLATIAMMPELPRGTATRARCAVEILRTAGLNAASPGVPDPEAIEASE